MKTDRLQVRMDYIEDRDKPYRSETKSKINYTEDYVRWLEDKVVNNINYTRCCEQLPIKLEIDFDGSLLTEIETTDKNLKVLRSVNGWGKAINSKKVKIDEVQR